MAGRQNVSGSSNIRVTLSAQSIGLLDSLAKLGIYGRNAAEVASRFVDERLREFITKPVLRVGTAEEEK